MTVREKQIIKRKIENRLSDGDTISDIASDWEVWPADIWNAVNEGYVSHKLWKSQYPTKPRVRFTADATPETIARIDAALDRHGMTRAEFIAGVDGGVIASIAESID